MSTKNTAEVDALRERIKALEEALRPFAHNDLCKVLGGNVHGPDSIVFGRDKAILKLVHFQTARALLAPPFDAGAHGHLITQHENS